MSETDLEKLDEVTNGTAAANKAVVLDGSKNIATLGTVGCGAITSTGASTMGSLSVGAVSSSATLHAVGAATFGGTVAASSSITAGSSFIIGSADMDETDLEKLDEVTNGTAAANKAVVLDGSKNIATLGTVGCGAITSTGASTMGSLSVGAVSSSATLHAVGAATFGGTVASTGSITAGNGLTVNSAVAALNAGATTTTLSASSTLQAVGAATLGGTLNVTGTLTHAAAVLPSANGTLDLGSTAKRYANVYANNLITGDLHMKNERGDWTLFEESDHIRIRNNATGQVFEMNMTLIEE
jgi:hypothetical protein